MNDKSVGIIGGMGPEATINLMQCILEATPAKDDQDHIHMIVDNDPKIPSRIKALIEGTGKSPLPRLQQIAKNLEQNSVDLIAMPCNTAHYYHADIQSSVNIPVLNMIKLAVQDIVSENKSITNVGILASDAVHSLHLYDDSFSMFGLSTCKPSLNLQINIMQSIKRIKNNCCNNNILPDIQEAVNELILLDANIILIACTELSLLTSELKSNIPLYDANKILAKHIVMACKEM